MGKQSRKVYIVGTGLTAFQKPRGKIQYHELGLEAAVKALLDAGINYDEVEEAYASYCFGPTSLGQRTLYQLGMTNIPIVNVSNACASASSAFWLARKAVEVGSVECALAIGFDTMEPGPITTPFKNHDGPLQHSWEIIKETHPESTGVPNGIIFGNGAKEYGEKYGATREHIAKIASKSHAHSVNNPYSQFQNAMTPEEVLKDRMTTDYLTRSMCCPTSDGAAAAIVCSEDFVRAHGLEGQAIEVLHQELVTDDPNLYSSGSAIELTGSSMTQRAAKAAFAATGLTPKDISVVELHDCFAANELLVYDGLGLSEPGKAHELVDRGDNTYGGQWVVNPSGGLLCKGHPLGATGLGMIFYIVGQLRGIAGPMQDPRMAPGASRPSYGLAHNLGLGGCCSVSILGRPSFFKAGAPDGRKRVGYEFGYECRGLNAGDIEKVRSKKAFSQRAAKKIVKNKPVEAKL